MPHDNRTQNFVIIIGIMVLLQHGQTLARRNFDIASGRFNLTGQKFQESGFACAIGTDNPVAVSRRKLQIYIFVQYTLAEL